MPCLPHVVAHAKPFSKSFKYFIKVAPAKSLAHVTQSRALANTE
jgi:hypothetical protein